jgi:tetratricopeptide (TPR) repeat protein
MVGKKKGKRSIGATAAGFGTSGGGAPGFGSKSNFQSEINKVHRLCSQGRFQEAHRYLQELTQRYPNQVELLDLHLKVTVECDDERTGVRLAARLLELRPTDANALYVMAAAAINRHFLVLAWELGQSALAADPAHLMTAQTQDFIDEIAPEINELIAEFDLPRAQAIEAMVLHEWAQFHLEWREFDRVEILEKQVLAIAPHFWSAHNNLSLAAFMGGNLPQAIDWCEQVLADQPNNIHALANLVRYCLVSGKGELAQIYGRRLKASKDKSWDPVIKKIEALSYLNDTKGILAIWDAAEAEADSPEWSGILLHWVAVAKARNGQAKEADRLWLKALSRSPDLEIARKNREDAKKPLGQRNGPWAFDMTYWFSEDLGAEFMAVSDSALRRGSLDWDKLTQGFERIYDNYPHWCAILELLLDRGDPMGRETVLQVATALKRPALLEMLRPFALGQNGSDEQRQAAAQLLVDMDYLDPEKVRMWIRGELQDVQLFSYEIHDDPPYDHPRSVLTRMGKILPLLRSQDAEQARQAETLLQEALAIRSTPDLLNNLAVSYQIQGRDDESIAIVKQLVVDYPHYIPARLSMAQHHLSVDEADVAESLLLPILKIRRIHYQNFALFSQMYLKLLVAKEELEKAQGWLGLWEELMPDHPLQVGWTDRLDMLTLLKKVQKVLEDKPPRKAKGKSQTKEKEKRIWTRKKS